MKKKFSRELTLILLAINWAVMILVISYFIDDRERFNPVLWTLLIGFTLQAGFLSKQLSLKKKEPTKN